MDSQPTTDPTERSRWRPLRFLQTDLDEEIARVYADAGLEEVRPSQVLELLRLNAKGPMTIGELAEAVQRTHSGTSQKVAAMRAAGLVRTVAGRDARTKQVVLTAKAKRLAARMAAEWRATEDTIDELEAEIPYPLSRAVEDLREALQRKSFHDRVAEKLAADDAWR
jgi:DNA-binding MarR family transcriptional regulator